MIRQNYFLTIAFDGTDYKGWQCQRAGIPTVQGTLNRVLSVIGKDRVVVTGSSRTDAGVHAQAMGVTVFLQVPIDAPSLQRALNAMLPEDIRVLTCIKAPRTLNARFSAIGKTYMYKVFFGQIHSPFEQRFAHHIPYPLDLKAMRRSLKHFLGEHDFSSFTSDDPEKKRTRTLDRFDMKVRDETITFTVEGRSFLRYMVRNMVGTVLDVGRGKITPAEIPAIMEARDRRLAGQTAPARGLTLVRVHYPETILSPETPDAPDASPS